MKTMRSIDGERIFRVTDKKAAELYHSGDAQYAPKEEGTTKVKKKNNKPSKAQKRQMRKTL